MLQQKGMYTRLHEQRRRPFFPSAVH